MKNYQDCIPNSSKYSDYMYEKFAGQTEEERKE